MLGNVSGDLYQNHTNHCIYFGGGGADNFIAFIRHACQLDIEFETNFQLPIYAYLCACVCVYISFLFLQNETEEMDGGNLSRSYIPGVPQTVSSEYVLMLFILF